MNTEPAAREVPEVFERLFADGQLQLLLDPSWTESEEAPNPPVEAIVGGWAITGEGLRSRFCSNPGYRPSSPYAALDPVDGVLRVLVRGGDDAETITPHLPPALFDTVLAIAVDEQGVALVRSAPDGAPSVLVATAYGHRALLDVPGWLDVTLHDLAAALPEKGVDVLLNPGAPASMRVPADVVRDIVNAPDGEL
ncbi:type VII secretion system-associated protein [Amycolatopsis sp. WQ 127309]|nr:type VII secretion system-associated protein [Amycolatopsis sp. WQ 127309]UOZ06973.1 type VII secretion system-associated protein [Amycolatopsis sp. WQ 127309]